MQSTPRIARNHEHTGQRRNTNAATQPAHNLGSTTVGSHLTHIATWPREVGVGVATAVSELFTIVNSEL